MDEGQCGWQHNGRINHILEVYMKILLICSTTKDIKKIAVNIYTIFTNILIQTNIK